MSVTHAPFKSRAVNTRLCPKCGGREWRYMHHQTPSTSKEWLEVHCEECGWSYPMNCRGEKPRAKKG